MVSAAKERDAYEKALIKCTDILCKNLRVSDCFPLFRSKFLLSREDIENIKCEKTTSLMTNKLIDILISKDIVLAFNTLYEYVTERCYQGFLGEELRKALKEAKNDFYVEVPQSQNNPSPPPPPPPSTLNNTIGTITAIQVTDENTTTTNLNNKDEDDATPINFNDFHGDDTTYVDTFPRVRLESTFDDIQSRIKSASTITLNTTATAISNNNINNNNFLSPNLRRSSDTYSIITSVSNINNDFKRLALSELNKNDKNVNLPRCSSFRSEYSDNISSSISVIELNSQGVNNNNKILLPNRFNNFVKNQEMLNEEDSEESTFCINNNNNDSN